ncbi:MAG TPA: helix-turn-helix transcriptional regulator [Geminicoccaceae bacterium]|nr:helix-turn-helix transcriptional regulator [Geminicoccus sp.]HMU51621.1 helix-turn-helix transcriptional regulator [Geminicoccaceae bacterium]
MIDSVELQRVIELLYAAALDGDWTVPVRALASLFGSRPVGLIQYDSRTRRTREAALAGIEPPYQETFGAVATRRDLDPAWVSIVARSAAAIPIIDRYAADPELSHTELYQEWLRPQGIHDALEVATFAPPRTVALLSVARPAGAAEFDGDAILAMRALQPHLSRALQIRQRLAGAKLERQRMLDALDRIEHGVLLVDADARILHGNRTAQALLRQGDGLMARDGTLDCARAADGTALRRLVGAAATGTIVGDDVLAVRRATGPPLSLVVAPLRGDDGWSREPAAMVIVTDREPSRADGAAELARRHGLTPAEARAALSLLEGGGLPAVADRLGVRLSTVRTLVQRAFAKTGTHRQSELVRLIIAPGTHVHDGA